MRNYKQIAGYWRNFMHIKVNGGDALWFANRVARENMDQGQLPPQTGSKGHNRHLSIDFLSRRILCVSLWCFSLDVGDMIAAQTPGRATLKAEVLVDYRPSACQRALECNLPWHGGKGGRSCRMGGPHHQRLLGHTPHEVLRSALQRGLLLG